MKTIWFDAATPKYALFYAFLIPLLEKKGFDYIITARWSENYTEAKAVLDNYGLKYHLIGNYGGASKLDKFNARVLRQQEMVDLFKTTGVPDALISGSVVDSIHTAFGLGIPVINFVDTPLRNWDYSYDDITIVTKLTIQQSSIIFYPDVIPAEVFPFLGVNPEIAKPYDFFDVSLWMQDVVRKDENDFRKKYELDLSKPTILVREEEYKAHYVHEKLNTMYEMLDRISDETDANIVIMPRYESCYLVERYGGRMLVLEDKLKPEQFYPFIDMLVGGGGTMNLEAAYAGIPVISLRSIQLFHDKYLIDNGMMHWAGDADTATGLIREHLGNKADNRKFFDSASGDGIGKLVNNIAEFVEKCAE